MKVPKHIDPTMAYDGVAKEVRRYYEANRESNFERWYYGKRPNATADNFMLGLIAVVEDEIEKVEKS